MVLRSKKASRPPDANALRPRLRDLFGEIPVSRRDLQLWLWSVPHWYSIKSQPRRGPAYLREYRVAEKIAAAKARGDLAAIFGDETCPHCGQTLESSLQADFDAASDELATLRAILRRPLAPVIPLRYHAHSTNQGSTPCAEQPQSLPYSPQQVMP